MKEKTLTLSSRINENAVKLISGIASYEDKTISKITTDLIERGLIQYLNDNPELKNGLLETSNYYPDFRKYLIYLLEKKDKNGIDKTQSILDFIGLNARAVPFDNEKQ